MRYAVLWIGQESERKRSIKDNAQGFIVSDWVNGGATFY